MTGGIGINQKLLGELIGLARTTDGNEHLINPSATQLIIDCLKADSGTNEAELFGRVDEVKRSMVPDCYLCASPCGKNDPFDMDCLQNEEPHIRGLKYNILDELSGYACTGKSVSKEIELLLYKALILIGIEEPSEHMLTSFHSQLHNLLQYGPSLNA